MVQDRLLMMKSKIFMIMLCISIISLTGCGNERSDNITTETTELTEKVVRNDLFNDMENVDSISYINCGADEHVIKKYDDIEAVMDFLKRLELEEAENPEADGTSGMDLYVNQQKIMSISYVGEYFCIDGKWYVTEDSGAGNALASMCISFSNTNG